MIEATQARSANPIRIMGPAPCAVGNPTGSRVRFLAIEFTKAAH